MMKKKPIGLEIFQTTDAMDAYLAAQDLGELFEAQGQLQKPKIRKINIDLPEWLIAQLDLEAARAGISRQPLIKLWLLQKLDQERKKRSI